MKDDPGEFAYTIAICKDAEEGRSADHAGVVQTKIEKDGTPGKKVVIGRYNETELMMGSKYISSISLF